MDDNTRAAAEAMIALAAREMDYSRVRAVRVSLDLPGDLGMDLMVESTLALDEAGDGPAAEAVFTAAAPAAPEAAPAAPEAAPAGPEGAE